MYKNLLCAFIIILMTLVFPVNASAQSIQKVVGIEIPVSKFKAKKGGKPSSPIYYVYHLKPKSDRPSPYLVYIPSSTDEVFGTSHHLVKVAKRAHKKGYGVVFIDINRGVEYKTFYNGIVQAPPRSIGALSMIEYIRTKYPGLSNGKFGAYGHSKGGGTTIEINKEENQSGTFYYRNVQNWFDAHVAYYPTCGDNNLVAPQLILIGEDDDWTSPANCRTWEKFGNTNNLEVVYLENATHVFEDPRLKGTQIIRGYKVRHNPKATKRAEKLMFEFFDKHLKFESITYKEAQERLNELGHDVGKPDGVFGKKSTAALIDFQKKVGLEQTGMLDQDTQMSLIEASSN